MDKNLNNSNKNYHHGDLKNGLIKSALEILATEGYKSLSLRKVAEKANVSVGAPYRHFKNLESLVSAVAETGFEKMAQKFESIVQKKPRNYLWQFRECGLAYVEFAVENTELFRIMYGNMIEYHSSHENLEKAGKIPFSILENILKKAQLEKKIVNTSTQEIALSAWSLVHGISNLIVEKQLFFGNWENENLRKTVKKQLNHLYLGIKFYENYSLKQYKK